MQVEKNNTQNIAIQLKVNWNRMKLLTDRELPGRCISQSDPQENKQFILKHLRNNNLP
jgi:hypothetical protein